MATTKTVGLLHQLYQELAETPETDPETQQRILDYAKSARRDGMLAKLCLNPGLAPSIDTQLAQITNSKVRAAWLQRPGRTTEEVTAMLDTAHTATVRAVIAAIPDLSSSVYAQLAEYDQLTVAAALLGNVSVPQDVVLTAARTFGRQYDPFKNQRISLHEALHQHGPAVHLAAWEVSIGGLDEWILGRYQLSVEQLAPLRPARYAEYPYPQIRTKADVWYRWALQRRLLTELMSQPALSDAEYLQIVDEAEQVAANFDGLSRVDQELANIRKQVASGLRSRQIKHTDPLLVTGEPSAVAGLPLQDAVAATTATGDVRSAIWLLAHPELTVEHLRALLPVLDRRNDTNARAALIGMAEARAGDNPRLAAEAFLIVGNGYLSLDRLPNAQAVLGELVDIYRERGTAAPSWMLYSDQFDVSVAEHVRLKDVLQTGRVRHKVYVAELLGKHLKTEAEWLAFESLADSFTGSFGDLLRATGYITT